MSEPDIHCAHDKTVALADLKPHPANPNTHPEPQIALLSKIIREQGWRNPIVVSNRSGYIVKGHGRHAAALRLGCTLAPVDYQDYASEKQELADMIADNRIAELAELDRSLMRELAEQLDDGAFDMDLTGFDHDALEELMTAAPPESDIDAEPQIDKAEELRVKWGVERGQIWELGEHRIMCGDSTADMHNLSNGEGFPVCFTSPPYDQQREYKGIQDWNTLMDGVMNELTPVMHANGSILVNLGLIHRGGRVWRYWEPWLARMDETDWPLFGWYVWDKLTGLMGDWRGRLAPAHEWIFHFAKSPKRANKTLPTKYKERGIENYKSDKVGLRNKSGEMKSFSMAGQKVNLTKIMDSVIRCQPARGGVEGHPAPFSVEFSRTLIAGYSKPDELVAEPFSGSGTTIIACEQLGRKCRAMEIDPGYVAVSIQRWADATGKTPKLLTSFPNQGKDAKTRKSSK